LPYLAKPQNWIALFAVYHQHQNDTELFKGTLLNDKMMDMGFKKKIIKIKKV
jgi:hypothetical protein